MKRQSLILLCVLVLSNCPVMSQNPFQSYEQVAAMENQSVFRNLPWKQLGPQFQGGRVECVKSPIGQPGIIYAGFGSGSLWKSTNQGLTWNCIFLNHPTSSIGDLAISQSNPDILYLGTGESHRAKGGFSYPGAGVFRSVDGGMNWISIGLHDTHHIGRIVVDPNNPNLVFVAAIGHFWSPNAERGLFITRDGGKKWSRSLFISDSTGIVDVAWDPVFKILYAASWDIENGKNSTIYRSMDQGVSWEKCIVGISAENGIGRIGLSVSESEPRVVYAVVDNLNSRSKSEGSEIIGMEVYRSSDSGKTWKRTHTGYLENYSGYGWAFGDIRISPQDANTIYVTGVHVLKSNDGGKSFIRLGGEVSHLRPSRAKSLHLDHYDLFIDPQNPDRIILASAGGVYQSYDNGKHWLHCNTVPAAEIIDMAIDHRAGGKVYLGTQDNAAIKGGLGLGSPGQPSETWDYLWLDPWSGGDGYSCFPDPTNSDVVYYELQNGAINRKDLNTGETWFIQPKPEPGEATMRNFRHTPFFVSRHSHETLYYAANKVYKSIDRGNTWYRISPDLCYPDDPFRKSRVISALAESPVAPGILYAGTDKGSLWVSRDDGINWFEVSKGLAYKTVIQILPSRHQEGRVYCIMKSSDDDDYIPYLFVSEIKGTSWKDISSGLPADRINCIIEDPFLPDLIFIGTDRGIYASPDGGKSWVSVSGGLTTVSVQKLSWAEKDEFLVAATHGMSMFACPASAVRKYFKSVDPAVESILSVFGGSLPGSTDFPGHWDWDRHRSGSIIWYQPRSGDIIISITDSAGKEILSKRHNGNMGLNHWDWDLILSKKEDSSLYPLPEYKFPAPGTYAIAVQGQGMILRTTLEIR